MAACRTAVELDAYGPTANWFLGLVCEQEGDFREATAAFQKAVESSGKGTSYLALLGNAYAMSGDKGRALKVVDQLRVRSGQGYVSPLDFAVVFTGLGDVDATFEWLEKAYDERTMRILELCQPMFDPLRSDRRFGDLMRRIGSPF